MNERIQTLVSEAEDYADGIVDQGGEFHEAYTKKFAELIVRECAELANEETSLPYNSYSEKIKKHFGVEE